MLWGFLPHLKNPTASAGIEPANSGPRGQHANHYTTKAVQRIMIIPYRRFRTTYRFCLQAPSIVHCVNSLQRADLNGVTTNLVPPPPPHFRYTCVHRCAFRASLYELCGLREGSCWPALGSRWAVTTLSRHPRSSAGVRSLCISFRDASRA